MSGGDMDDASSALIAKLLMQDQLGADYDPELFGAIAGEADDDYSPAPGSKGRRRASGGAPAKRGRKAAEPKAPAPAAAPAPAPAAPSAPTGDPEIELAKKSQETAAKGDASADDKIARGGSGFYTDEEERKFLEGLELYGRDWGRLSAHVGTRDRNSIRSHTQKYFLRLYRSGTPLPAKVLESGAGYTLSGKPLDPDSAAARPYMQAAVERAPAPDQGGPVVPRKEREAKEGDEADKEKEAKPAKRKKAASPPPPPPPQPTSEVVMGRTRYAKDRLRQNTSVSVQHLREMTTKDPLTMVRCVGLDEGDEPFTLTVHANALLVADFHAHLSDSEIIGFLGGHWDAVTRRLVVTEAFPCKTVASDDDVVDRSINVEMSPESDVAVREEIERKSLQVVGWYHSHPVFQPDPSIRDIENQASYQHLCRDHTSGVEPFVGLIISPYDVRLPTEVSQVNYFMVQRAKSEPLGVPTALSVTVVPDADVSAGVLAKLDHLAEFYATFSDRVNLEEVWRYFAPPTEAAGPAPPLKPLSKLQKLEACLLQRFQKSLPADAAAKQTTRIIQELQKWAARKTTSTTS